VERLTPYRAFPEGRRLGPTFLIVCVQFEQLGGFQRGHSVICAQVFRLGGEMQSPKPSLGRVHAAVIEPAPARMHERGQPPRTYPDPPPVAAILRPQMFPPGTRRNGRLPPRRDSSEFF
jgi:hypothetical protein